MANPVYTYDYNRDYSPAMPVVDVGISEPSAKEPEVIISMLLDSGADGTIVPASVMRQTSAKRVGVNYLRGVLGHRQKVDLYLVRLSFGSIQLSAIQVAVIEDSTEALIGRDALNQLEVTLNGLASVTEVRS